MLVAFRVVKQDFWTDEKVIDTLTIEDKYFFLYLLTNPHSNQLGIYKLPIKYAAFECGYSKEQVIVLIDRFQNTLGLIKYNKDTQEVAIGNFLYHSIVSGGAPVLSAVKKDLEKVTDLTLIEFVLDKVGKKSITNNTVKEIIYILSTYINKDINNITNKDIYINTNNNVNGDTCHESYHDTYTLMRESEKKGHNITLFNTIMMTYDYNLIKENPDLLDAVTKWFAYKDEKKPKGKNEYTVQGMNAWLKKVVQSVDTYGVENMVSVINQTILNNYMGIIWEWLDKNAKTDSLLDLNKKAMEEW